MLTSNRHTVAAAAMRGASQRTTKIRSLNDAFRQRLPKTGKGHRLIVTDGLGALTIEQFANLLLAVKLFSDFGPDNDPHGEHDFGSIEQDGTRYYFKIDYFDQWMQFASKDPTDPSVTTRVLTIMLASEYKSLAMRTPTSTSSSQLHRSLNNVLDRQQAFRVQTVQQRGQVTDDLPVLAIGVRFNRPLEIEQVRQIDFQCLGEPTGDLDPRGVNPAFNVADRIDTPSDFFGKSVLRQILRLTEPPDAHAKFQLEVGFCHAGVLLGHGRPNHRVLLRIAACQSAKAAV